MAGRRYVVGIGVSKYDDASLDLDAVPGDVAKVTEWFASGARIPHEVALAELCQSPTNEEIRTKLADWLAQRDSEDYVVVYLAAHGAVSGNTAYVLGRNSPRERLAGRAIDGSTIGEIVGQSPPHNVLLIIDACVAGDLGFAIQSHAISSSREYNNRDPYRKWAQAVVCSTFGRDPAHDGRFAQAFLNVVTHERWTGALYPFLNFDRLMEGLSTELESLGVPQVAERLVWGPSAAELIPNPNYGARQSSPLVADEELATHFDPSSRGVSRGEPGWYFIGRYGELRRIVSWLAMSAAGDRSSLLVITGSPGSGKSALISRVIALSDPSLRARVPDLAGLPADTVPPESSIRVALWCHNKTIDQLVTELGSRLALTARTTGGLVEAVGASAARSPIPVTIAIDALDEAVSGHARRIAAELVVPLTRLDGVRVLIATRRQPAYALSESTEPMTLLDALGVDRRDRTKCIDMDLAPDREADISAYVVARLMGLGETGKVTPYTGKPELAAEVAKRVTDAAKSSFLVAAVTARALAARPDVVSAADLDDLPSETGEALASYIRRLEEPEVVTDILRPLAWAEGSGLPWGCVWAPVATALAQAARPGGDVRYDDTAIARVLDRASDLVVEGMEGGQSVYRLFHTALAEQLRHDLAPAQAHSAIARALDTIVGSPPYDNAPAYALTHLTSHFAQAPDGYDRLYALATSPDWARAKRQRVGHTTGFLHDVDLAIHGALGRVPQDFDSLTGACLVYARQMACAPAPVVDILARSGQLRRAELMANNIAFALERCWAYALLAPTLYAEQDVAGAERCLAEAQRAIGAINATHAAMAWAWIAEAAVGCRFQDRALAASRAAAAVIEDLPDSLRDWELSNVAFWAGKAARHSSDAETLESLRQTFTASVRPVIENQALHARNQLLAAASVLGETEPLRVVWSEWMKGGDGRSRVRLGNLALALAGAGMTTELDSMLAVVESQRLAPDAEDNARKRFVWALAMTGRFTWAFEMLPTIGNDEQRVAALGRIVTETMRRHDDEQLAAARLLAGQIENLSDVRSRIRFVPILYALGEKDRATDLAEELVRGGVEPSVTTTVAFPKSDAVKPVGSEGDPPVGGGTRRRPGKTGPRHLVTQIAALDDEMTAAKAKSLAEAGDVAGARAALERIRVPQFRLDVAMAMANASTTEEEMIERTRDALLEARFVNEEVTRWTAIDLAIALSTRHHSETRAILERVSTVTKTWVEAEFAEQYQSLRESMPSGPWRTRRLDDLMTSTVSWLKSSRFAATLPAAFSVVAAAAAAQASPGSTELPAAAHLLSALTWSRDELAALVATGHQGKRAFALVVMECNLDGVELDDVQSVIEGSISAFEQYHALRIALQLVPRLNAAERASLRSAIERERKRYILADTDRYALSERILEALRAADRDF